MRCQKCGFISFDWLETCGKCGASLGQQREVLGHFLPDNGDVNWFIGVDIHAPQPEPVQAETAPEAVPDISKVDVSDLLPEEMNEGPVDIEETELIRAAEDEDFQKALEEIAR